MAQGVQTEQGVRTDQGGNQTELFTVWYNPAKGKAECCFNTVLCFQLMQAELQTGHPFGTMRDIAFYCMNASQVALQYDQQMLAINKNNFENQNQGADYENWDGSFYGDEEQYAEDELSMLSRNRKPRRESLSRKSTNIHDQYEEEVASKVNANRKPKPKPKKPAPKGKAKDASNSNNIHDDYEREVASKVNTNRKPKPKNTNNVHHEYEREVSSKVNTSRKPKPKKTTKAATKTTSRKKKHASKKEEGELSESSEYEPEEVVKKSSNARETKKSGKEKPRIIESKKKAEIGGHKTERSKRLEKRLEMKLTSRKAAEVIAERKKAKGL